MARTDLATAVIVVRCKSGKRGNFFARNAADLRHAHQDGDRCRQPDAVHALDQVQPFGQIGMLADRLHQCLELGILEPFETCDLTLPEVPDTRVPAARAASLEVGDILRDLIDQRQMFGIGRQTGVRRSMDLPSGCRTGRDQGSIDFVVFRQLQMEHGIGPHLCGLEYDHQEPVLAQLQHDGLLIAAARLDPDPFDLVLPQPSRQGFVTIRSIVYLQPIRPALQRHIELVFASIDASADHAMLAHLRRPFLVMRTLGSFNHPGPMKKADRDLATEQPSRLRVGAIRRSAGPAWVAAWVGPFLGGTCQLYAIALIQGWAKALALPSHITKTSRAPCPPTESMRAVRLVVGT